MTAYKLQIIKRVLFSLQKISLLTMITKMFTTDDRTLLILIKPFDIMILMERMLATLANDHHSTNRIFADCTNQNLIQCICTSFPCGVQIITIESFVIQVPLQELIEHFILISRARSIGFSRCVSSTVC